MKFTINIGSAEATIEQADENWITQQISRRRDDGAAVCVRVVITESDADFALVTPACAGGGGGSRQLNRLEERILELWRAQGLTGHRFTGGNVVAFLHQLRHALR
jgi:hypothetical protein